MAATRAASRLQPGEHLDRAASGLTSLMQCYWHEHGTLVMEHTVVREAFVLIGTWALMRICTYQQSEAATPCLSVISPLCLWFIDLLSRPEQRYISSFCLYHICIRAVTAARQQDQYQFEHDLQVLKELSAAMLC